MIASIVNSQEKAKQRNQANGTESIEKKEKPKHHQASTVLPYPSLLLQLYDLKVSISDAITIMHWPVDGIDIIVLMRIRRDMLNK